jgi:orotate phosphoribosyltransferase
MKEYKKNFIDYAINIEALKFGSFELKSGRQSPYFFNMGCFNTGKSIQRLGNFYAQAIIDSNIEFDCIFGPAYKGIPLVIATAIALNKLLNQDIPWSFNRKEVKQHGEGGVFVGSKLHGKVLIIDDVITSGKAINEAITLIRNDKNAKISGCLVSLDRQEKSLNSDLSSIEQISLDNNIQVTSIVKLQDLIEYSKDNLNLKHYHQEIANYKNKYGI